jgi:succinyl-diaminopimelate desuccinylase
MNDDALTKRLADTTLALCSIASVTGDERAIADELERRVRQLPHVSCRRVGETVIAEIGKGPVLALFGHSDTVKPATDQPLGVAGDRVFGCGASDMKGGLAVMLELLGEASRGDFSGHALRCVFYDKEEGPADASGILPALEAGVDRDVDLALCLEPTDNRVEAGCIGGLHVRVVFPGKRAHSARPWQGHNAIYEAIELLTTLRDRPRRAVEVDGLVFYEVLNATMASTENSRNVIPDRFTLNLNFRFAPGRSTDDALAELRALVPVNAELHVEDIAPSGAVRLSHPRLRAWIARRGLTVASKQAWTDVARLAARGLTAVNFGPGATAEAHQARESIAIASLVEHHQALRDLLGKEPSPGSFDLPR